MGGISVLNFEQLQTLVKQFDQSSLKMIQMETKEIALVLSKNEDHPLPSTKKIDLKKEQVEEKRNEQPKKEVKSDLSSKQERIPIKAPLVGLYYKKPAPDKKEYVQIGDTIKKGQTIGIIEAMKVMNEIPSPVSGIVEEILVENEQLVEFDQVLIRVKKV